MKLILSLLSFIICQVITGQDLVPFQKEGKYGFIVNGDEVIQPVYDYVTDFSNRLACVKVNDKWGFIDQSGEWIINPKYDRAQPFRGDFAMVSIDGKIGLISTSGEEVVAPQFEKIVLTRDGVETINNKNRGLILSGWKDIPTKYNRVGKTSMNFAYGKNGDDDYDIYTQNGLFLSNQKHSFSKWSKTKDGLFICSKNGKYGLYSESMHWLLEPKFEYIEELQTNEYREIDENGEETKYYHIFAVFEKLSKDSSDLSEKTAASHSIKLLKASSLQQIGKNITGYEQMVDGYGYRRKIDYKLYYEDNSNLLISNFLYPDLTKKVEAKEEELFINGLTISKLSSGNFSLRKGENKILEAKHISQFSYVMENFDEFGDFYSESHILETPYLWIVGKYSKAIYNTKKGKYAIKNLPLDTEYEAFPIVNKYGACQHLDNEIESYLVRYNYAGKFGVFNCRIQPTKMVFERIDLLQNTGFVKVVGDMTTEGKVGLSVESNPTNVLMEADNFVSSDDWAILDLETFEEDPIFKNLHFVIIQENDKYGILGQRSEGIYYDSILPSDAKDVVITVVDGKYGVYDILHNRCLDAKFEELPKIARSNTHPEVYILKEDGSYLGIDNRNYKGIDDFHFIMETEDGSESIGFYDDILKKDMVTVSGDYKLIMEDEYPLFKALGSNNLWGMINHKGDTIMPFEFSDFGEPDLYLEGFNIAYDDYWKATYSKKGLMGLYSSIRGELIPAQFNYYEELYDLPVYRPGLFWTQTKKGSGIYDIEKGEIHPPIYDYFSTVYEDFGAESDLLIAHKGKHMGLMNLEGGTLLEVEYDIFEEYREEVLEVGYPYAEIGKKNKRGIYSIGEQRLIVPIEYDYIESYYEGESSYFHALIGHKRNRIGIHDLYGNLLFEPVFEYDDFTIPYSKNDTVVLAPYVAGKYIPNVLVSNVNVHPESKNLESIGFDFVSKYCGYTFEGDKLYETNLFTNEKILSTQEIVIEGYNFDIFVKNGKFGARNKDGEILIEPIYDNARVLEYDVMIGYEDGVKYYIYVETNERYTEEEW